MLSMLKMYIERAQFKPTFIGMFVNPFFIARKGLYQNIVSLAPRISGKTLDVGCGQKPYEHLFVTTSYIGLEIDTVSNRRSKHADFFYDGSVFPFKNCEFNSIVMNEVLEHVFMPESFLTEVNRVLTVDGIMLMTVPFVWDEHEHPNDFARYSSFGLRWIIERHGFEIIEHIKSVNDIRVIFQLINAYLYKITVTQNVYVNILLTFILMAPWTVLGELLSKVLPRNDDLYLDNIILARKVRNAQA